MCGGRIPFFWRSTFSRRRGLLRLLRHLRLRSHLGPGRRNLWLCSGVGVCCDRWLGCHLRLWGRDLLRGGVRVCCDRWLGCHLRSWGRDLLRGGVRVCCNRWLGCHLRLWGRGLLRGGVRVCCNRWLGCHLRLWGRDLLRGGGRMCCDRWLGCHLRLWGRGLLRGDVRVCCDRWLGCRLRLCGRDLLRGDGRVCCNRWLGCHLRLTRSGCLCCRCRLWRRRRDHVRRRGLQRGSLHRVCDKILRIRHRLVRCRPGRLRGGRRHGWRWRLRCQILWPAGFIPVQGIPQVGLQPSSSLILFVSQRFPSFSSSGERFKLSNHLQ